MLIRACHRRHFPGKSLFLVCRGLTTEGPPPVLPDQSLFDAFTRRREGLRIAKKRQQFVLKAAPLSLLPSGLVNPLIGPTNGLFPDLRDYFVRAQDNTDTTFLYPLDRVQIDEMEAVLRGFITSHNKNGLNRVATLTYAETMGEEMLERLVLYLANCLQADCLTLHARDYAGLLNGCSKSWYGRPYFDEIVNVDPIIDDQVMDDPMPQEKDNGKWLSHFLKSEQKTGRLPPPPQSKQTDALSREIKESVNLHSVLSFLQNCADQAEASAKVRIIHLSGFGQSLTNTLHKSQIIKFIKEQQRASGRLTLLIISEHNPKADIQLEDTPSTTMPIPLASFVLTKGRCEKQSEIPNTPDYDCHWLIDRATFGGLKFFLVPPKDPNTRKVLTQMLRDNHMKRVGRFNIVRIVDVLQQLGIKHSSDLHDIEHAELTRAPLMLSEAIYIGFMAKSADGPVSVDSLKAALDRFVATRTIHQAYYTKAKQTTTGHKLDEKSLSKYEKRFLPCIVTPSTLILLSV